MVRHSWVTAASLAAVGYGQLVTQPLVDSEQLQAEFGDALLRQPAVTSNEVSSPTICDSTVKQHSGYLTVAPGSKYFFWMFESRNEPSKDPLILWMTGGPGCSSQLAALRENGPCNIFQGGNVTRNEHSWNNKANVIYVDQPSGTGFSTGLPTTHDEIGVATKMNTFMQEFYKALPQFKPNDFYIFGESYGGHYVPAVSHFIWQQGKSASGNEFKVPLKGIGVGNGLTNPGEQYKWYPDMAKDGGKSAGGTLEKGVITNFLEIAAMKAASKFCTGQIAKCNSANASSACSTAYAACNYGELVPYQLTGYNPYDMRIKCDKPPLCYDFGAVEDFLNSAEVQKQLGVSKKWGSCNMLVNAAMQGDYMKNYHTVLPEMLADGVRVVIYAGDVDYICNWLGNKKWTLALDWAGKDEFNKAADKPYMVDGQTAGRIRASKGFHFLQVYQAGHMVPMDKPAVAAQMVTDFLADKLGSDPSESAVVV
eukprot:TRINITY_DN1687_c0_g2_i1.p1 TRINITY_DN1687_c0_g2~~TRINITY_DN1687_c0_g2_i1.p1  ORF type:complete len:480 (+),score=88.81 TRINITY_DN1687_c0_g2_i1:67-1506(+)